MCVHVHMLISYETEQIISQLLFVNDLHTFCSERENEYRFYILVPDTAAYLYMLKVAAALKMYAVLVDWIP